MPTAVLVDLTLEDSDDDEEEEEEEEEAEGGGRRGPAPGVYGSLGRGVQHLNGGAGVQVFSYLVLPLSPATLAHELDFTLPASLCHKHAQRSTTATTQRKKPHGKKGLKLSAPARAPTHTPRPTTKKRGRETSGAGARKAERRSQKKPRMTASSSSSSSAGNNKADVIDLCSSDGGDDDGGNGGGEEEAVHQRAQLRPDSAVAAPPAAEAIANGGRSGGAGARWTQMGVPPSSSAHETTSSTTRKDKKAAARAQNQSRQKKRSPARSSMVIPASTKFVTVRPGKSARCGGKPIDDADLFICPFEEAGPLLQAHTAPASVQCGLGLASSPIRPAISQNGSASSSSSSSAAPLYQPEPVSPQQTRHPEDIKPSNTVPRLENKNNHTQPQPQQQPGSAVSATSPLATTPVLSAANVDPERECDEDWLHGDTLSGTGSLSQELVEASLDSSAAGLGTALAVAETGVARQGPTLVYQMRKLRAGVVSVLRALGRTARAAPRRLCARRVVEHHTALEMLLARLFLQQQQQQDQPVVPQIPKTQINTLQPVLLHVVRKGGGNSASAAARSITSSGVLDHLARQHMCSFPAYFHHLLAAETLLAKQFGIAAVASRFFGEMRMRELCTAAAPLDQHNGASGVGEDDDEDDDDDDDDDHDECQARSADHRAHDESLRKASAVAELEVLCDFIWQWTAVRRHQRTRRLATVLPILDPASEDDCRHWLDAMHWSILLALHAMRRRETRVLTTALFSAMHTLFCDMSSLVFSHYRVPFGRTLRGLATENASAKAAATSGQVQAIAEQTCRSIAQHIRDPSAVPTSRSVGSETQQVQRCSREFYRAVTSFWDAAWRETWMFLSSLQPQPQHQLHHRTPPRRGRPRDALPSLPRALQLAQHALDCAVHNHRHHAHLLEARPPRLEQRGTLLFCISVTRSATEAVSGEHAERCRAALSQLCLIQLMTYRSQSNKTRSAFADQCENLLLRLGCDDGPPKHTTTPLGRLLRDCCNR